MSVNTSVSHKNFGKHVASEITSISLLPLSPINHSNVLPRPFENVQTVDFCLMSNSNSTFGDQLYAGESECHQEFIPGDSWFVFIWLVYISTFKRGKYSIETFGSSFKQWRLKIWIVSSCLTCRSSMSTSLNKYKIFIRFTKLHSYVRKLCSKQSLWGERKSGLGE